VLAQSACKDWIIETEMFVVFVCHNSFILVLIFWMKYLAARNHSVAPSNSEDSKAKDGCCSHTH
jgi:hypothetical protein